MENLAEQECPANACFGKLGFDHRISRTVLLRGNHAGETLRSFLQATVWTSG